eukprot:TRINITY_DN12594_c0_g1_i2.p1 TRINITY_DN12594_c0_g1~~TRINITY_DN12594_c0_g1_i2.p1  ORF type:complete len:644 (+),score=138.43 TRINITY_DN12594_c0_g1_i2:506-2437(+)
MTSWDWCVLCDFALFKPTSLAQDNTAEFSFYFDSMGRRTCYLAPERFVSSSQPHLPALTPAMDVFSAGCAIAELFLDGEQLFDLAGLTGYRKANGRVTEPLKAKLSRISSSSPLALSLVKHMTQLDPKSRYPAPEYMSRWPQLFPSSFGTQWHPLMAGMIAMTPDARLHRAANWLAAELKPTRGRPSTANSSARAQKRSHQQPKQLEESVLLLAPILSSIRCAESRATRVEMLGDLAILSGWIHPSHVLERVVPYLVHMLRDEAALVRAQAVHTLSSLITGLSALKESYSLIVEYVLPGFHRLVENEENLASRCSGLVCDALAQELLRIVEAVHRAYLVCCKAKETQRDLHSGKIENLLIKMLTSKIVTAIPAAHRRLIFSVTSICSLIGNERAVNLAIPLLLPSLNSTDPQVCIALLRNIPSIAAVTSTGGAASNLFPCVLAATSHPDIAIAVAAVQALASMCELGLIGVQDANKAAENAAPLLVHQSQAARVATVELLVTASNTRELVQTAAMLLPLLKPYLSSPPYIGCSDSRDTLLALLRGPEASSVKPGQHRASPPPSPSPSQLQLRGAESEACHDSGCIALPSCGRRALESVAGHLVVEFHEHAATVSHVVWLSAPSPVLVSGSNDGVVKIWEAPSV